MITNVATGNIIEVAKNSSQVVKRYPTHYASYSLSLLLSHTTKVKVNLRSDVIALNNSKVYIYSENVTGESHCLSMNDMKSRVNLNYTQVITCLFLHQFIWLKKVKMLSNTDAFVIWISSCIIL